MNKKFKFKYRDAHTGDEWRIQTALCRSVEQLVDFYGLDEPGVEYEILEVS